MYLIGLRFVRDRFVLAGPMRHVLPMFSVLILLAPLVAALQGVAAMPVLSVIVRSQVACRQAAI